MSKTLMPDYAAWPAARPAIDFAPAVADQFKAVFMDYFLFVTLRLFWPINHHPIRVAVAEELQWLTLGFCAKFRRKVAKKGAIHIIHKFDRIGVSGFPRAGPFRKRGVIDRHRQQMQVAHIIVNIPR